MAYNMSSSCMNAASAASLDWDIATDKYQRAHPDTSYIAHPRRPTLVGSLISVLYGISYLSRSPAAIYTYEVRP